MTIQWWEGDDMDFPSAKASEGHSGGELDGSSVNFFSAYLSGVSELQLDTRGGSLHSFSLPDLREGLEAPDH